MSNGSLGLGRTRDVSMQAADSQHRVSLELSRLPSTVACLWKSLHILRSASGTRRSVPPAAFLWDGAGDCVLGIVRDFLHFVLGPVSPVAETLRFANSADKAMVSSCTESRADLSDHLQPLPKILLMGFVVAYTQKSAP